jgi:hypothetical protein
MLTRCGLGLAAISLLILASEAQANAGGGGNGVEVGGLPAGYWVGAQSATTSTQTEPQTETQVQPAAPTAPLPANGNDVGTGTGQAQTAANPAPPQSCGFQLSYCEAAGINVGASQISTSSPAPPAQAPAPVVKVRQIPPVVLAEGAWQALDLPAPQVHTAPPRGSDGWVGIPEYFWLAPGQWTAHTARAQAGAEWAQVTAQPAQMTVTPGTGLNPVTCDGPGTAYDQPGAPCTYLYQQDSLFQPAHAYTVTVTVAWDGTWQGAGGTGGVLPPVTRTTTFALPVAEGQALVDQG